MPQIGRLAQRLAIRCVEPSLFTEIKRQLNVAKSAEQSSVSDDEKPQAEI
jgi:hypothetical protein